MYFKLTKIHQTIIKFSVCLRACINYSQERLQVKVTQPQTMNHSTKFTAIHGLIYSCILEIESIIPIHVANCLDPKLIDPYAS